jgi:hypothetical protein
MQMNSNLLSCSKLSNAGSFDLWSSDAPTEGLSLRGARTQGRVGKCTYYGPIIIIQLGVMGSLTHHIKN